MSNKGRVSLIDYNQFCESLVEGNILYNIDTTNLWGEYLLVANITSVRVGGFKTYTVLLLGLKKEEGKYIPIDLRIKLTPEYTNNIPFLKPVGFCKFKLFPELSNININTGLVSVYGNVDLWKYRDKLNIKKPRKRKYDSEGKLIIKKTGNK